MHFICIFLGRFLFQFQFDLNLLAYVRKRKENWIVNQFKITFFAFSGRKKKKKKFYLKIVCFSYHYISMFFSVYLFWYKHYFGGNDFLFSLNMKKIHFVRILCLWCDLFLAHPVRNRAYTVGVLSSKKWRRALHFHKSRGVRHTVY